MGLALLFAGCSDDYTDWAQPKQNAQEAALSAALNIEPAAAIDYANVTTDSLYIRQLSRPRKPLNLLIRFV